MTRAQTRALVCGAGSLAMIIAATLIMDWYRLALDVRGNVARIAIDLRHVQSCNALHVCTSAPLGLLPGMYPSTAAASLWASLAFAALVVFQTGTRLLSDTANESASKLGYVFALVTILTVLATAYLFGPETEGPTVTQLGGSLHRTWAPLTLIAGLVAGCATLYVAVAPQPTDLGTAYKPITLVPTQPTSGTMPRAPSTGPRTPSAGVAPRRISTGSMTPLAAAPPGGFSDTMERRARHPSRPARSMPSESIAALAAPDHLRNRMSYIALTAELTGGGLDVRREDGSSRLVLWRDVVGVVARRMPPELDGTPFVDIISTAGSTLRIVPWTRLTGAPIEDGDARPRGIVERVVTMCPGARLDPATREFLDTGEAAQLPDLETLQAHDTHLA